MPRRHIRISRSSPHRAYRKPFIIATEGAVTERQYFEIIKRSYQKYSIKTLHKHSGKSAPKHVLETMKRHIGNEGLHAGYEAWLVLDDDGRPAGDFASLRAWVRANPDCHYMALSNPSFEYWLLLHFEDGTGAPEQEECERRLKIHGHDKRKRIDSRRFHDSKIRDAVRRAEQRDTPPCVDYPLPLGRTKVYRLVKKLID